MIFCPISLYQRPCSCYFATDMADENLTRWLSKPTCQQSDLCRSLGLPEARDISSLPHLRLGQVVIKCTHSQGFLYPLGCVYLTLLLSFALSETYGNPAPKTVTSSCYGLQPACVSMVSSVSGYNYSFKGVRMLLSYDIAVDRTSDPSAVQTIQKSSRCYQFGQSAKVYCGMNWQYSLPSRHSASLRALLLWKM